MKTTFFLLWAFFLLFFTPFAGESQNEVTASEQNIFSRLQQYDPLQVVIETDVKELKSGKADTVWQPGVFKIIKDNAVAFEQKVQLASRGHMRKKTCDFPPVKIRFYEGALANDSIEDVNELKLVVGCRNSETDDQLVLKECLAYKLFNLITEESFRAKQATLRFETPGRKKGKVETTAYFIESERELATRLGGRPVKARIISPKGMDSTSYDRMTLFQFMIGNTDWGFYTRHNIKVIGFKGRPAIAVPYDFDYSGMVGADYAIPAPEIPVQNVQQRYYLGFCRPANSYNTLFKEYLAKKEPLLQAVDQFPGLSKGSRAEVRNYLKGFFEVLEDPRKARTQILENCDKRLRKEKDE